MNWKDIVAKFAQVKIINEGNLKKIESTRMTRCGLELNGFFVRDEIKAVILFGREEYQFLSNFSKKEVEEKIERIFEKKPPVVILSRSFKPDILINIAKKHDITVLFWDTSSSEINTIINLFLHEQLSIFKTIHGNLIEVFGIGVLLIGESGLGKSEITLELVKKGHLFVADDVVEYTKIFNDIYGRSSKTTRNFIEVRGLGILNLSKLYGIRQIKESTKIDVIIELMLSNNKNINFERIGKGLIYKDIEDVKIPYYIIPVLPGRKISDLIEVIIGDLKLKLTGYSSSEDFFEQTKVRS